MILRHTSTDNGANYVLVKYRRQCWRKFRNHHCLVNTIRANSSSITSPNQDSTSRSHQQSHQSKYPSFVLELSIPDAMTSKMRTRVQHDNVTYGQRCIERKNNHNFIGCSAEHRTNPVASQKTQPQPYARETPQTVWAPYQLYLTGPFQNQVTESLTTTVARRDFTG